MDQSLDEIIAGKHSAAGGSSTSARGESSQRRRSRNRKDRGGQGPRRAGAARGGEERACVLIRNLHRDISSDDLRDLFREVGPVVRVLIDTERNGRRTGVAWVLYEYGADAAVAAGRFDGRRAVGQIISVRQVSRIGDLGSSSVSLEERLGPKPKRERVQRKKAEKKVRMPIVHKSAEELDAELDAYMHDIGADSRVSAPAHANTSTGATAATAAAIEPATATQNASEDFIIE